MCQLHGSFLSITAAGPGGSTSGPLTATYGSHHHPSLAVVYLPLIEYDTLTATKALINHTVHTYLCTGLSLKK